MRKKKDPKNQPLKTILKNLKLNDLVELDWVDHYGEQGWQSETYIKQQPLLPCKTLGYYVGHTNDSVKLAGTLDKGGQYNNVSHRIMSAITGIRKLK